MQNIILNTFFFILLVFVFFPTHSIANQNNSDLSQNNTELLASLQNKQFSKSEKFILAKKIICQTNSSGCSNPETFLTEICSPNSIPIRLTADTWNSFITPNISKQEIAKIFFHLRGCSSSNEFKLTIATFILQKNQSVRVNSKIQKFILSWIRSLNPIKVRDEFLIIDSIQQVAFSLATFPQKDFALAFDLLEISEKKIKDSISPTSHLSPNEQQVFTNWLAVASIFFAIKGESLKTATLFERLNSKMISNSLFFENAVVIDYSCKYWYNNNFFEKCKESYILNLQAKTITEKIRKATLYSWFLFYNGNLKKAINELIPTPILDSKEDSSFFIAWKNYALSEFYFYSENISDSQKHLSLFHKNLGTNIHPFERLKYNKQQAKIHAENSKCESILKIIDETSAILNELKLNTSTELTEITYYLAFCLTKQDKTNEALVLTQKIKKDISTQPDLQYISFLIDILSAPAHERDSITKSLTESKKINATHSEYLKLINFLKKNH